MSNLKHRLVDLACQAARGLEPVYKLFGRWPSTIDNDKLVVLQYSIATVSVGQVDSGSFSLCHFTTHMVWIVQ